MKGAVHTVVTDGAGSADTNFLGRGQGATFFTTPGEYGE